MSRPFAVVFVATLLCSASALAQSETIPERGYTYEFLDDPLAGVSTEAQGWLLRLGHRPARTYLLRPRTHWVHELNRSVETM